MRAFGDELKGMKPHIARRVKALLLLLACSLCFVNAAASSLRADPVGDPILAKSIDAALDIPELKVGFQGIAIVSLRDHTELYTRNADRVFLPASNNKLLTSSAALALLGRDFVYRTRLYRTGPISDEGVLSGDLVLRGAGDPILAPEDLDEMIAQVKRAGVVRVTGRLRYDDSLFDRARLGDSWAWDDEPYYYSAQISALNLNENLVSLQPHPGKRVGDPVRIDVEPTSHYTRVINQVKTGAAKSEARPSFDRVRGQNTIVVSGTLPVDISKQNNNSTPLTIENPSRFTSIVFLEKLRKEGIRIDGDAADGPPVSSTAEILAEHVSVPLSEMLKRLNKPSDNLIAECLLKTIGAVKRKQGTGGFYGTGSQEARGWFGKIGLDLTELQQADGSGLSRGNYISPRNMSKLLAYWHTSPDFNVLYDSLPIAGVDGSLRNRLKGTAAEKNCHAKTGYIGNVSSLSGYVTTKDGEMLAFSILMNNHLAVNRVCVAVQDKIVAMLADYKRPKAEQHADLLSARNGEPRP